VGLGFADVQTGSLVDVYGRSAFPDTRRKAEKFGARGTTLRARKPG
jgi:hypothetical protein